MTLAIVMGMSNEPRFKWGERVRSTVSGRSGVLWMVARDYKRRVLSIDVKFDGDEHVTSCRNGDVIRESDIQ